MAPDLHANFAYSTVATAPSPATSGTSLVVAAGNGALFPTPPFNVTIWPTGTQPLSTNAEIARVTGVSTDTFTIVRAQESTSARTVVVGDQIAATITKKTLVEAETTVLSYVEWTADVTITSTTAAGANTVATAASVTVDGSTQLCVEVFSPAVQPGASGAVLVTVWQDSTDLGIIGYDSNPQFYTPLFGRRYVTPSAGSYVYSVRAWRAVNDGTVRGGSGGSGNLLPGYIRVTKGA